MKEMQKVSSNFERLRKQGQKKKDTEIKPFIENQWHKDMDMSIKPLKFINEEEPTSKKVGFKKAFSNIESNSADFLDSEGKNSEKIQQSDLHGSSEKNKATREYLDDIHEEDLGELYNPHIPTSP